MGAGNASMIGIGRLSQGATTAAAQAEFFAVKQRLSPELGLTGAHAVSFIQTFLGDVRPVLIALTAAVGLLLLIACVNVGNLLLLRASGRARELAIRRALGATYGDIVAQLLVESGLLAVGGGLLGLTCADVLLRVLVRFAPAQLPRIDVIQLSGAPIAAALGVTVAALVVFGVGPALFVARGDVGATLRLDARSGQDSTKRRRLRYTLVASQTALALVMLSGTMLLARSLSRLQTIALGYEPSHLSLTAVSFPVTSLGTSTQLIAIGEDLIRRYRAIPGIVAITPVYIPPLLGANVFLGRLDREGQSDAEKLTNPIVPVEAGNGDYFKAFGIPIIRGRAFTDADRENTEQVAVVSEAVARRMWPNQDPIGKRIHYWSRDDKTPRTVIGVVGDVRLRALRESTPAVFLPWHQTNFWQGNFAVRTTGPIESLLPAMRRETIATNGQLNLWYAKSMDDLLAAPLAQPRMSALLMTAFGLAALLLAAIGLYGVMASVVRESTREIGIRMALGAAPERLRSDVLGRALGVAGAGAVVGILIALGASRVLAGLLYEVSPTDPVALAAACVVLLIVVSIAAYVPARRATKIDPALALRSD
jgi:predicted permease